MWEEIMAASPALCMYLTHALGPHACTNYAHAGFSRAAGEHAFCWLYAHTNCINGLV